MAAGLGDTLTRAERKTQSRAGAFRFNPDLERLIAHPEQLDLLSPATAANLRMELGYYRSAKQAAADAGLDVSG